ncbi:MAG: hypothetical protein LBQ60_11370 [Bacteroidales bacterium]|jgi:hypothetical protein|nr:hypothetical protein [Bacteroidales bacterium]
MDIVKSLANYIIDNKNRFDYGFANGLAGNCLFLYESSKSLGIDIYGKNADNLLDGLFDSKLIKRLKPDFIDGLSGIGWCLEYFLKQGFCTGDRNEILEDIDIAVFKVISENRKIPLGLWDGLIGYLFYVISRLENNIECEGYFINIELFKELINRIDEIAPDHFPFMVKDARFELFWTYSMLFYVITKSLKLNIYNEKIVNVLKQWILYIETLLPSLHSHRLSLAISLLELNKIINLPEIEKQINILLFSIDYNKFTQECDIDSFSFNLNWIGQVFILKKATILFDSKYSNYNKLEILRINMIRTFKKKFEERIAETLKETNAENKPNSTLLSGLSGIGLMYSVYPECIEC